MTVILLLHPKSNCMTIPPVVPVNSFSTISSCGSLLDITFSAFYVYFYISITSLCRVGEWLFINAKSAFCSYSMAREKVTFKKMIVVMSPL